MVLSDFCRGSDAWSSDCFSGSDPLTELLLLLVVSLFLTVL